MKKQLLTLVVGALISSGTIYGQQPSNADFELWEASGGAGAEDPIDWSSSNEMMFIGVPELIFKSTDANTGAYALSVTSIAAILPPPLGTGVLDTISGIAVLGDLNMDNPGVPFTSRPSQMSMFTKGTVAPEDLCLVMAELSKWNGSTMQRETVGDCFYMMFASKAAYTEELLTFNYATQDTPDTLSIMIIAGNPGGTALPGNEIIVDDISFNYPVGIQENISKDVLLYPNPANTWFTLKTEIEGPQTVTVINMQGKVVLNENFQSGNQINIEHLSTGLYTYIVQSEDRNFVRSGKLSITH